MTRSLLVSMILLCAPLAVAKTSEEAINFLQQKMAEVKGETQPVNINSQLPPPKCGTPVTIAIFAAMQNPENKTLNILQRPTVPDTFGTAHFLIHYATTGSDSVYQPHIDSIPGVPRHVTRVAQVFEHAWSIEIDSIGFTPPPGDNINGGDSRYDIYLVNLGFGFFGFTTPESTVQGYHATSYIELENDFAESPRYHTNPLDGAKVTAAHEFFHAVQFSYDAFEYDIINPNDQSTAKPWWLEASATWMEDVVYTSINDYIGYLPFYYKYMWMGLGTFSYAGDARAFHPYASAVWPIYLSQKFDDLGIIKQIWEQCGAVRGYNTLPATNSVLNARGSDLSSAFLEFEVWNFHTGSLADTVRYFREGRHFPEAETTAFFGDLTSGPSFQTPNNVNFPEQFATNYIVMNSIPSAPGGVVVTMTGQAIAGQQWRDGLLGFKANASVFQDMQVNQSSGNGSSAWIGWNTYRCIVLIPTVTGLNPNYSDFPYFGTLSFDPTLLGTGTPGLGITQAYPSPFVISDNDTLTIPYSLDKIYSKKELGVSIYDASGGLVRKIPGENFLFTDPGDYKHGIRWNGKNSNGDFVSSGIYILVFRAGSNSFTGKIAVVNNTK
jgi:hypothetical protein